MKNAKIKKALAAGLSVALVASLAAVGTVSYLESTSGDVVNTFNKNNVNVNLTEKTGSDYNIIPGTSEKKDPTVTVDNSVDAYVYVKVMDETNGLVTYNIAEGWEELDKENYPGVYYREVKADDEIKTFSVLEGDQVSYDAKLTNEDMPDGPVTLTFKAFAIQTAEFENAVSAYVQAPIIAAVKDSSSLADTITDSQGKTAEISITSDIDQITGIRTTKETNLTIDFNDNTVSVAQPVGSTNTVTNGMQLLKDSTVNLVNGTYTTNSNKVKILIQNYSDLTLKDFTLDAHDQTQISYVLSNNCGDVLITGATNILAADGKYAFDAYYWPNNSYTSGVRVVIDENMTGLIKGKIEFSDDNTDTTGAADPALHSITIKGGYFTEDPSAYVPTGYKVIDSTETFTIGGNTYTAKYQVVPENP